MLPNLQQQMQQLAGLKEKMPSEAYGAIEAGMYDRQQRPTVVQSAKAADAPKTRQAAQPASARQVRSSLDFAPSNEPPPVLQLPQRQGPRPVVRASMIAPQARPKHAVPARQSVIVGKPLKEPLTSDATNEDERERRRLERER